MPPKDNQKRKRLSTPPLKGQPKLKKQKTSVAGPSVGVRRGSSAPSYPSSSSSGGHAQKFVAPKLTAVHMKFPQVVSPATPFPKGKLGGDGMPMGQSSFPFHRGKSDFEMYHTPHGMRCVGTDFIGVATVPLSGFIPGALLFQLGNSATPVNTRLANFGAVFQRWRPYRYGYNFIPTVGSTTPGAVLMAIEPDPAVVYLDGDSLNVNRLKCLSGSKVFQLYDGKNEHCSLPPEGDYTSLWTYDPSPGIDASDRLDLAGTLNIVAVAGSGTGLPVSGNVIGVIELVYDIEFFEPRLLVESLTATEKIRIPVAISTGGVVTTPGIAVPILNPTGTITAFFNSLANGIKSTPSLAASVGLATPFLAAFLRRYKIDKNNLTLETREYMRLHGIPEPNTYDLNAGFPYGNYTIQIVISQTNADMSTAPDTGTFPYNSGANVKFINFTTGDSAAATANGIWATQYDNFSTYTKRSYVKRLEYEVIAGTGYGDIQIGLTGLVTALAGTAWTGAIDLTLSSKGINSYVSIPPPGGALARFPIHNMMDVEEDPERKLPESKEEKKSVAKPTPPAGPKGGPRFSVDVEDDYVVPPTPPVLKRASGKGS